MPPQVVSESDSDGDVIPAKSLKKALPVDDDVEEDVQDNDNEDAGDDEEEFVVEAIKDHKYDGKVQYASLGSNEGNVLLVMDFHC